MILKNLKDSGIRIANTSIYSEPRIGHVLPLIGNPLSWLIPLFISEHMSFLNSSSKAFSSSQYSVDGKPHNQFHPISSSDTERISPDPLPFPLNPVVPSSFSVVST